MSLRVYSTKLRAWISLAMLDAEEATLKEGGGVAYSFAGNGEDRFVRQAVFTGVREGGNAFLICAGLTGAILSLLPDGRAQWCWTFSSNDELQSHRPYSGELAIRETLRPTGTN